MRRYLLDPIVGDETDFWFRQSIEDLDISDSLKEIAQTYIQDIANPYAIPYLLECIPEESIWEQALHIKTKGIIEPTRKKSCFRDEKYYEPTQFWTIGRLFNKLSLSRQDIFVDVGCGLGRVINIAVTGPFRKVIGLDCYADYIELAYKNIKQNPFRVSKVELIDDDIIEYDITEGTVFWLFNPFGRKTFEKFIRKLKRYASKIEQRVTIVYVNPVLGNILLNYGFKRLDYIKFGGDIISIYEYR